MSFYEDVPSADEFNSMEREHQDRLASTYYAGPEGSEIRNYFLEPRAVELIHEMLSLGCFVEYLRCTPQKRSEFHSLFHNKANVELVFFLHSHNPYDDIDTMEFPGDETFQYFDYSFAFNFDPTASDDLKRAIHKYFRTYGYIEDPDNPDFEREDTSDPLMAITVLYLSEMYGESKVIPLLYRISSGDVIDALELMKIVRAETEVKPELPLKWLAAIS